MKKPKSNEDPKVDPKKKPYVFGTAEKIVLETSQLEHSVFALMHGVDGCDPRRGTLCSPQ